MEQGAKQAAALQAFVGGKLGRARFIMKELLEYGYAKELPREFDHITNYFCVGNLANTLEEAAHRARADLMRDGYPLDANGDTALATR